MAENGFLPMGKIVGAHGVRGTLKVHSYAESFSVFKPGNSIRLRCPTGEIRHYTTEWVKPHNRILLLCVEEVRNRDEAEALIGSEILIEKASLPELEEGTYYWTDLIGLSVFSVQGEYLGQLTSIISTGSNDVYIVKNRDAVKDEEICVPALESVVVAVDLERKTMKVDLPEGLL